MLVSAYSHAIILLTFGKDKYAKAEEIVIETQ